MPIRIQETTKENLVETTVPIVGAVTSHKFIMDYMEKSLANAGYSIEEEIYRATTDGSIAQCMYKLGKGKLVAWSNSYLPGMRFKCGSGIYFKSGSSMIQDEESALTRKVDVDVRIQNEITSMFLKLENTYSFAVDSLKEMKLHNINYLEQGQILGTLFGSYKILTSEQAAQIAKEIKPNLDVNLKPVADVSIASFYNTVAIALQRTHPKIWMDNHRIAYNYFSDHVLEITQLVKKALSAIEVTTEVTTEVITDPNQVNMLEQIKEIEEETVPLAIKIDEAELVMPNQQHKEVLEEPIIDVVEIDIPVKVKEIEIPQQVVHESFTFTDDDDEAPLSFDL